MYKKIYLIAFLVLLALPYIANTQPLPPVSGPKISPPVTYFVIDSTEWVRLPESREGISILSLQVAYYGSHTLLDTEAFLKLRCNAEILEKQPITIGSWNPGTPKVLTYTINTTRIERICPAELIIRYKALWKASTEELREVGGTKSISFSVEYCSPPRISILVSPETLYSGTSNNVKLKIVNGGATNIIDLDAVIEVTGGAILGSARPIKIALKNLEAGEEKIINLDIMPQATQVNLQVTLDYVDECGRNNVERIQVNLPVLSSSSIVISASPHKLYSGSTNKVTLHIMNLGSNTLHNTILYLSASTGSQLVISPQVINVGEVPAKSSKDVNILVEVPASSSGVLNILYTLIYETDSGSTVSIRDTASIFVVQQAQLAITSIELAPSKPVVGESVIISINIMNLGLQPLYSVNVTVQSSKGLRAQRSTYYFIGQLQPQVPTSIPFSFKVLEEGKHDVKFIVTFKDAYGLNWNTTRSITFRSYEKSTGEEQREGQGMGFYQYIVTGAIILAIILVAAYLLRHKRRERSYES